ncbi:MAG: VCBS repeat-containing protein [Planctomycetes bacterium]|nr:VCBS repeat-containing protein [Planctomycetota bacterium]
MIGRFSLVMALCVIGNGIGSGDEIATIRWRHLSSVSGDLPAPDVGKQSALVVFDIDNDGADEFAVAGWGEVSMVWYQQTTRGWARYLLDDGHSHIEAGGAVCDIDGDGDLDLVHGGSWASPMVWWWENPCPHFVPGKPWRRHLIKSGGPQQHHDQIFGDFDGDGRPELVFWNQRGRKLLIAEIPTAPRSVSQWPLATVWSWPRQFKYEGLAKGDIDRDGQQDIVGGGYWFRHEGPQRFSVHRIDDYGKSRSAVGQLIAGGRPEVVLNSGDGVGPLNLYRWDGHRWKETTLIPRVDHGHTLQLADLNGDGHLDIYAAEMHTPGAGGQCRQWVLYGDGSGRFVPQVVSTGIGTHEGKLGDVDGDGDVDIVQKDFQKERRVDIWLNLGPSR